MVYERTAEQAKVALEAAMELRRLANDLEAGRLDAGLTVSQQRAWQPEGAPASECVVAFLSGERLLPGP